MSLMFLLCLFNTISILYAKKQLNLTYGTLKFNDNAADEAVGFETLEEYHLFLESNNLDPNEPGYLVNLTEANKNKYAACLDGSPEVFYYRKGYDDISKMVDGVVVQKPLIAGPLKTIHHIYILDNQYADNPLSYNWNAVYIRYCDGSSFSGYNSTKRKAPDGTEIYFKGWNNLNAVLDELRDEYGLLNATHVILSGLSAGGLATWLHTDYIAEYIGVKENNVNFLSIPDSGFFVDYPDYDGCMKWVFDYHNTSIALNAECKSNNKDHLYKCMLYTE